MKGRSERVSNILIQPKAQGVFNFTLPAGHVNGAAEIWMAVYQKPKSVQERGKTVTYSNVMKHFISLGVWRGESLSQIISPILDNNSAGFAIVAQEARTGKIIAAGNYKL